MRLGLRDHQGDWIADIADSSLRERVLRREVKRFARVDVDLLVGLQRSDPAARQIVAGQDSDDAWPSFGGRGIDRLDIRMRVRRAQDDRMRHVLELHIVDITALAGQEPGVFDASRRIADFEFCHAWPPHIEEITRGGEVANAILSLE